MDLGLYLLRPKLLPDYTKYVGVSFPGNGLGNDGAPPGSRAPLLLPLFLLLSQAVHPHDLCGIRVLTAVAAGLPKS